MTFDINPVRESVASDSHVTFRSRLHSRAPPRALHKFPEIELRMSRRQKNLRTEMFGISPPVALCDYANRLFVANGLLVGATAAQGIVAVADAHDASCQRNRVVQ